jgi:hypothetical protein
MSDTRENIVSLHLNDTVKNTLFVTIQGREYQKSYADLGLSFESSEEEIMARIVPIIQEEYGEDITGLYKVRKTRNNENIFVIPNSTAG